MQNHSVINVCLIDDHHIVLEGLRMLLESADDVHCSFATNTAADALQMLDNTTVDIVITDIEIPEIDGITLCGVLKAKYPHIKVIALTMYNERSLVRRMIEAGADGYLLKNAGRDELLSAIRRVHSGKSYYDPDIAEMLVRSSVEEKSKSIMLPSLSSREKQIVQLIMEEMTSHQIATLLNISFNTVETHRRNIMDKLNTKNSAGIVRIVMENKLLD